MSSSNRGHTFPGSSDYMALIPAAGHGTRLPGRRLSKELLPFGGANADGTPVISHLLSCLQLAGVTDISIVIRQGKWDILDYLSGEPWDSLTIASKITRGTSGVPETVAFGLRENATRPVVFGFPDILFRPKEAIGHLLQRAEDSKADVVLGLFPTDTPHKMDMVDYDESGKVTGIEIKPERTKLNLTWILAVWQPAFSKYLLDLALNDATRITALATNKNDNHLGQVFKLAMRDGLSVDSVSFPEGRSLDIGTPGDLEAARNWLD